MKSTRKWAALALMAGFSWSATAIAADPVINGPTQAGEICMQKVFNKGAPVTNSNRLGCTASDIKIAKAKDVFPKSCIRGTKVNLKGTFEVVVTANIRYDAGFFFRLDGGSNARGDGASASGMCSLSALDPNVPRAFNADGDSCGDLAAGTYEMTFDLPDVDCVDPDNNGKLNLPNCTSWHSNAGTACQIGDPFTFNPETKSKCNCDDTFEVEVEVANPSITVTKIAVPTEVNELGDAVTFTATVVNDSQFVSAKITSLKDAPYGDLANIPACTGGTATAAAGNRGPCTPSGALVSCPSLIGTSIPIGGSRSCSFQVYLDGNAGQQKTDTVTACVITPDGRSTCGDASATVDITDLKTLPGLMKTAVAASCRIDATYTIVVDNPSPVDVLTVKTLTDDRFGNITSAHPADSGVEEVVSTTCGSLPRDIARGGNYSCQFVGRIPSGTCELNHTNKVTAETVDDDGIPGSPSDTAKVTVSSTRN